MVSKGRREDTQLKRRPAFRMPKRRILIVCEGEETERGYFKCIQHEVHNPRVHVEVAKDTGVPLTVVSCAIQLRDEAEQEAKRLRDEFVKWDEVWGVFDVDEHPNLDQAVEMAHAHGIELSVSNPCFELWALLHFQDQRAYLSRQQARALLKKYMPDYEKTLDFKKMHVGYSKAVERARSLDDEASRNESPGQNPTTGVHRLTEAIRTR